MSSTALVVSTFEAELQPVAAASAVAALERESLEVCAWDAHLFTDAMPNGEFALVLLSVQQFEGLERALELVPTLRAVGAQRLVAFGQYARLNADAFLSSGVDAVAVDEPERFAERLAAYTRSETSAYEVPGLRTDSATVEASRKARLEWEAPNRTAFPSIVHYPMHHTPYGLMGNIEVTRGCHHRCTYCSVYGAYGGGVVPISVDAVVNDALAVAEQGARHFTFIDAEFFNSRRLGRRTMEAIRAELGPCTFDFTTRVDHILQYRDEIERMVELGLRQITSALEFPSDRILRIFDKGINVADMRLAIATADELGVRLNPTFIPFNPWVTFDELQGFEGFLIDTGLSRVVDHTALQTRLLLFKGSPLLSSPWIDGLPLHDQGFHYEWEHPDPRVEELWRERREEAEAAGKVRCCVKC